MFHVSHMQRAQNIARMGHARFDMAHAAQTSRDARGQMRHETRHQKGKPTPPDEIWMPCHQGCSILAKYGVPYLDCVYECTKGGGWEPKKASATSVRQPYRRQPKNAPPPPKTCPPGYTLGPTGCVDAGGNPPPSPGWPTKPGTMSLPDVTHARRARASAQLRRANSHLGAQPADTFKYNARLLRHYADELVAMMGQGDQLPQWAESKLALIWSDVSDVTHHMRDELTRMMPPTGRASNFWRRARNFAYPIQRKRNSHGSYMAPYAVSMIRQYADWLDQSVPDEWGVPDWAEFKLARASGRLDDVAHYVEYMRGQGESLISEHIPATMIIEEVVVQPRGEGGLLDVEGLSFQDRLSNPCSSCSMLMVAGRKKNSCYPGASVFLDNMRWMYPPHTQTYVQGY